jgi:hypothetical protein
MVMACSMSNHVRQKFVLRFAPAYDLWLLRDPSIPGNTLWVSVKIWGVWSQKVLVAAGFEPAQPKLWQLECHPLDHSGTRPRAL